ncbi:AraC family transcriptional regulator [Streptomyces virginiae]|uniref:AraC family transcriptional regulator n=1 Tax=Streptomyces virginiae TaxID=1961 RepID=UPI0030D477E8
MDVLTDVLAVTKTGGTATARLSASAPWGVEMSDVPVAAFHAVIQGACWLRLPGMEPIQLVAGDITLMAAGGGHALSSEPTGPLTSLEDILRAQPEGSSSEVVIPGPGPAAKVICGGYRYSSQANHPLLSLLPPVVHLPADQSPGRRDLADCLRMLASELLERGPGSQTLVDRLVDVLLVHIVRQWLTSHDDAGASWLRGLRDPEVAATIALMHERPAHPWTIEELARRGGVSRATLVRRFTALAGEPPQSYLTRWRMELAARSLREGREPLGAIAGSVGYTSEFAFSRAFTRARGESPGRYRSAHRSGLPQP